MAPVESTWHSAEILQDLLKAKRPRMEILWNPMGILWTSSGTFVESCANPIEISIIWNPVEIIWKSYANPKGILWKSMEILWKS